MSLKSYLPDYNGSESLEKFVQRWLHIPKTSDRRLRKELHRIFIYLHDFPAYFNYGNGYTRKTKKTISMIVKGGSLGKATAVRRTADLDLIVFFNGYSSMEKFIEDKTRPGGILDKLSAYLTADDIDSKHWIAEPRSGQFHITLNMEATETRYDIRVEVLPAINVIGSKIYEGCNMDPVYVDMARKSEEIREHYSTCLVQKQRQFVRKQSSGVKNLIKLIKYWKNENDLEIKSYMCELLAVHVARQGYHSMRSGFQGVLDLLVNYDSLKITFSDFYQPMKWEKYFPRSPYVIDPANPFQNTCMENITVTEKKEIESCAMNTRECLNM
ncbi:2'-5'-oligoadenylate synthase 1 [Patella vulgata]|uniref:2'-5'-oligoadenylate synthase 1 n=1 Tax=Patella vulgata TaxID=6465 RepID=UPI0024A99E3A|nr:2'-5'-oligoadenylate synthase 1 [Patella vulgata]XP_055954770.1 2'-5'-oligoadenylate synthase 1 [Patella vulgata]